ncbi:(2Fe-2S)-binding protein [Rhizobium sp. FKL33]|uniref:(2Fe-2S)-binding protein n=1 Tax=Rhizobium sp. FKL33 TaxID=2562307 RepID=UPI0010C03E84|nr:(2Fe-2S)-binding protein [Rhizobium sp. FKL33]
MNITFILNGESVSLYCPPDLSLATLLRDHLGMMGTKIACGLGRCGACLALIDGKAVNSCLTMAWRVDGADIVTVEGLDALPEGRILREALIAENAFQCGYCAPGFSIALLALFKENPVADEAAIRAGLKGNLCRCTGYHSILRGALSAAAMLRAERATGDLA